jgi:PAS domain S-box-containing protein
MQDIYLLIKDNINWFYYALSALGILYTFYRFSTKVIKKTDWFNLLKLITEVPATILEMKDRQTEIFHEIKLQNKLVNSIIETLELAQFLCDSEGKCIKVNSKWISLTGLSEEEAYGHNWLLSIHYEDRDKVQKKWVDMIEHNTPFEEVFRYRHRVTKMITKVKCTATDVVDENNNRLFIIGLSRVL